MNDLILNMISNYLIVSTVMASFVVIGVFIYNNISKKEAKKKASEEKIAKEEVDLQIKQITQEHEKKEEYKQFIQNIKNNHLEEVKEYIQKHNSIINTYDESLEYKSQRLTLLMYAAANGYDELVEYLCIKGADVNSTCLLGNALNLAASNAHIKCVKTLIAHDINLNILDNNANTPLLSSISHPKVIQYLILKAANVTIKDKSGESIMCKLINKEDIQSIELLIANNFDIDSIIDDNGETSLSLAIKSNKTEVVKILLELNADTKLFINKKFPLEIALENKNYEIAILLLENGANIDQIKINKQSSLLSDAVFSQDHELIKFLLQHGADINQFNRNLAHIAIFYDDLITLKILIDYKVILTTLDSNNKHTLELALENDNYEITKLLIENKFDVNKPNSTGEYPLEHAYNLKREPKFIELLLENKANPDLKSIGNDYLIVKATKDNNTKILELLIKYNAATNPDGLYLTNKS